MSKERNLGFEGYPTDPKMLMLTRSFCFVIVLKGSAKCKITGQITSPHAGRTMGRPILSGVICNTQQSGLGSNSKKRDKG